MIIKKRILLSRTKAVVVKVIISAVDVLKGPVAEFWQTIPSFTVSIKLSAFVSNNWVADWPRLTEVVKDWPIWRIWDDK